MRFLAAALFALTCTPSSPAQLFNLQAAAKGRAGIEVKRAERFKSSLDDTPIIISFDKKWAEGKWTLIVRDPEFEKIGKFPLTPNKPTEVSAEVSFTLSSPYLPQSYLDTPAGFIPLRIYFDAKGEPLHDPEEPNVPPTSDFFVQEWRVQPDFISTEPDPVKGKAAPPPVTLKPKPTQEQMVRSWGLFIPEGTIFYYGLPYSGMSVNSTADFLKRLDRELRKRGARPAPRR